MSNVARPAYLDYRRKLPHGDPLQPSSVTMDESTPKISTIPVIIKLIDGKVNFREMPIAERDAFIKALQFITGELLDSNIPRGGDLFGYPTNETQQKALLDLDKKSVASRIIACKLPNSVNAASKKVIFDVPTGDSVQDILLALQDQGVIDVQRGTNWADRDKPTDYVFLYFASETPPTVRIAGVSYEVKQHIPNPYRCRNCWHLGHTQQHCNASAKCKKCGSSHNEASFCTTKCVNCGRPDHEADSSSCPAFLEMKQIIRSSISNNISIREARARHNALSNNRPSKHPPTPSSTRPPTQQLELQNENLVMKQQIAALQADVKKITESTIPAMASNINDLAANLQSTRSEVTGINNRMEFLFQDLKNTFSKRLAAILL